MQTLRMQLHPHFLFNAIHTISSFMHKILDHADRVLSQIGDLLRYTLRNVSVQMVASGSKTRERVLNSSLNHNIASC